MTTAYSMLFAGFLVGAVLIAFVRLPNRIAYKLQILIRFLSIALVASLFAGTGKFERLNSYEQTHLVAGSESDPRSDCIIPTNATAIFFGDFVSFGTKSSRVVLADQTSSEGVRPVFVTSQHNDFLAIQLLQVFNRNGLIITDFHQDRFWINANLRAEKLNYHHLVVFNDRDEVALDIDYLNKHAIRVLGNLFLRDATLFKILPHQIRVGQVTIAGGCTGENGGADVLIRER